MIDHLFLFILLALVAEILGTVGGFGSSLFFVPLAGYFFDFHSVLGITALFHVCSNVTKIGMFRQGINKQLIFWVGIPAVLFVALGAALTKYFESAILQLLLSVFLIVLSSLLLIFRQIVIRPTFFNSVTGGALSGLTAGLLGSGGAIRGLTLAAFSIDKYAFIATSAIIDLGVDVTRTAVYFANGYIHAKHTYLILILLLVSIAGTYAGKRLLNYFTESQFRYLVLALILLTGISGFVKEYLFKSEL